MFYNFQIVQIILGATLTGNRPEQIWTKKTGMTYPTDEKITVKNLIHSAGEN